MLDDNKFDSNKFERNQLLEVEEIWVSSSVSNNVQMVFDIESFEPILRKVYFDETEKEFKAKAKIKRGHKYFVFNIESVDDSGNRSVTRELSNLDKGKYYKEGRYCFPKDLEKASICFENDGSPEALFNIAKLYFRKRNL